MSKDIHTQKHMTLSDRIFIEQSLAERLSLTDIGRLLKKDPTTISKEIRKHRAYAEGTNYGRKNDCKHIRDCKLERICDGRKCLTLCKHSKHCDCSTRCSQYESRICDNLQKAPYVCNGCKKKSGCKQSKYYYRAKDANGEYEEKKRTCRQGIDLTSEERANLDTLVTPLLKQGQTMDHIFANHADEIPCSKRTLYRYIHNHILSVDDFDLPRKLKYKPRKTSDGTPIARKDLPERTYRDFEKYIAAHPEMSVVEMDTVFGCIGSKKVLLTMFFRNTSLMIIFLLPDKTNQSVINVFDSLKERLGAELFSKSFPIILTDRGSEFANPSLMECDKDGVVLSKLFYRAPNAPYQKGRIEKNHEYIRYILPKGSSFDDLSQRDINLICCHINSIARTSLNNHTPFELAAMLLNPGFCKILNLAPVAPDALKLKPTLLKR